MSQDSTRWDTLESKGRVQKYVLDLGFVHLVLGVVQFTDGEESPQIIIGTHF